jgi:hypothetical protein
MISSVNKSVDFNNLTEAGPKLVKKPTIKIEEKKEDDDSFDEKQFNSYRPAGVNKKPNPPSHGKKLSIAEASMNNTTHFDKMNNTTATKTIKKGETITTARPSKTPVKKSSTISNTALKKTDITKLENTQTEENKTSTGSSKPKEFELEDSINNVKPIEAVAEFKKKEVILPPRKKFTNNVIETVTILVNSDIIEKDIRFVLALLNKEILKNVDMRKILTARIGEFKKTLSPLQSELNEYSNEEDFEILTTKIFNPSKTALNGLNFVTKEEVANLCKKEQAEEIINIFKLLYIFLKEDFSEIENPRIVENFIQNVLPAKNIDGISK